MTRLFKSAAGMGQPSSRCARLGLAHTGHLQKRRYTNRFRMAWHALEPMRHHHSRRCAACAMLSAAIGGGCVGLLAMLSRPPLAESALFEHPPDADAHERYAAARLQLAELKVERAENLNRVMPGLLTQTDMRRLRNRVVLLGEQLEATRRLPHGNAVDAQEAAARVRVRIAAEDLEAARAVRARNPAAVSDNELQQLEVKRIARPMALPQALPA